MRVEDVVKKKKKRRESWCKPGRHQLSRVGQEVRDQRTNGQER